MLLIVCDTIIAIGVMIPLVLAVIHAHKNF